MKRRPGGKHEPASSSELERRLGELARLMIEARDLTEIDNYFHDQLVPFAPFLASSELAEHGRLVVLLRMLLKLHTGDSNVAHSMLSCLQESGFWHGSVVARGGGMGLVLYFEKQNRGLFCFATSLADAETRFSRFSIPDGLTADADPDSTTLVHHSRRTGESQSN